MLVRHERVGHGSLLVVLDRSGRARRSLLVVLDGRWLQAAHTCTLHTMTNAWCWPGALSALILFTTTCTFLRRVQRLSRTLFSEKTGAWGTLYKAAIIGKRMHWQCSLACALMGVYIVFRPGL